MIHFQAVSCDYNIFVLSQSQDSRMDGLRTTIHFRAWSCDYNIAVLSETQDSLTEGLRTMIHFRAWSCDYNIAVLSQSEDSLMEGLSSKVMWLQQPLIPGLTDVITTYMRSCYGNRQSVTSLLNVSLCHVNFNLTPPSSDLITAVAQLMKIISCIYIYTHCW